MNVRRITTGLLALGLSFNPLSVAPAEAAGRTSVEICNNTIDPVTVVLAYSEDSPNTNYDFTAGYWNVNPESCLTANVSYGGVGGYLYGYGFFFLDDGQVFAHEPAGGNDSASFCVPEIQSGPRFYLRGSRARECSGRQVVLRDFVYLGTTNEGQLSLVFNE